MHNIFIHPRLFAFILNLWPPFFFSGIKIQKIADDYQYSRVILKNRPWNVNIHRSQYGGSLFSMTDAMYALMLYGILGKDYLIWDRAASIEYIKPGYGKLSAEFILSDEQIEEIKSATDNGDKFLPIYQVNVKDKHGEIVCIAKRTLYIRKRRKK